MRALYLVVLITLCLPLQAGDPADLNTAVEMFRSPHATVRTEGSKLADRELRKLLAPLLKAMEDPDPEVRRRVREAILGLVPHHGHEPEREPGLVNANAVLVRQWNLRGLVIQNKNNAAAVRIRQFGIQIKNKNVQKGAKAVGKFGVTGKLIKIANAGFRGLRVNEVLKGSAAEQAGLLKGDTILSVNGTAFTYEVFLKALDPRRGWSGVKLRVMRGARIFEITVK